MRLPIMYTRLVMVGADGQPYPFFYGYKTAGIFQNQAQVNAYVNSKGEDAA